MARLKVFLIYLICFVAIYFFVDFGTFAYIKSMYNNIDNYEIKTNSPIITIKDIRATYINGYIEASIYNNTGNDINLIYVDAQCYSKRDVEMGTSTLEINDLKNGERRDFRINFRFQDISKIIINTSTKRRENSVNANELLTKKDMYVYGVASLIVLYFSPLI